MTAKILELKSQKKEELKLDTENLIDLIFKNCSNADLAEKMPCPSTDKDKQVKEKRKKHNESVLKSYRIK